jgi:hypothetical protein
MNNGVVHGFSHGDQDVAVTIVIEREIISDFINQSLDDGDVFRL